MSYKPNYLDMFEHLAKWEGKLSNDPNDKASEFPCPYPYNGVNGYHTNGGITWRTYLSAAKLMGWPTTGPESAAKFFTLTDAEKQSIFKVLYWDKVDGDNYSSQAISNIFTQWAWGSGVSGALVLAKEFLKENGTTAKDFVGVRTEVNKLIGKQGIQKVFDALMDKRKARLIALSMPGTKNNKFRKGWLNRHGSFYKFNLGRL